MNKSLRTSKLGASKKKSHPSWPASDPDQTLGLAFLLQTGQRGRAGLESEEGGREGVFKGQQDGSDVVRPGP